MKSKTGQERRWSKKIPGGCLKTSSPEKILKGFLEDGYFQETEKGEILRERLSGFSGGTETEPVGVGTSRRDRGKSKTRYSLDGISGGPITNRTSDRQGEGKNPSSLLVRAGGYFTALVWVQDGGPFLRSRNEGRLERRRLLWLAASFRSGINGMLDLSRLPTTLIKERR